MNPPSASRGCMRARSRTGEGGGGTHLCKSKKYLEMEEQFRLGRKACVAFRAEHLRWWRRIRAGLVPFIFLVLCLLALGFLLAAATFPAPAGCPCLPLLLYTTSLLDRLDARAQRFHPSTKVTHVRFGPCRFCLDHCNTRASR